MPAECPNFFAACSNAGEMGQLEWIACSTSPSVLEDCTARTEMLKWKVVSSPYASRMVLRATLCSVEAFSRSPEVATTRVRPIQINCLLQSKSSLFTARPVMPSTISFADRVARFLRLWSADLLGEIHELPVPVGMLLPKPLKPTP